MIGTYKILYSKLKNRLIFDIEIELMEFLRILS
jgi:hypothetical protein